MTPPKQFTLCTDHRPLETMSTVHKKTLNNLQLLMLKFNFVIEYKEGWRNTVAYTLSRTHAAAPICVITRSGRRTAEDNSVPEYRGAEEDEEEEQDPANEDEGEILSGAIVAQPPQATPRRDLESTIGVNHQKEQDKDERNKNGQGVLDQFSSAKRTGKSRLGGHDVESLHSRGQRLVVQDKDQDQDHDGSLGTTFSTSARLGGRACVARWRPPRRNNDDRQSQTRVLQARHDVRHKCICTQVSTVPEGKGKAAEEGGAHVNANLQ
jgi:hypothetical protein